jgi:hypothetical protein
MRSGAGAVLFLSFVLSTAQQICPTCKLSRPGLADDHFQTLGYEFCCIHTGANMPHFPTFKAWVSPRLPFQTLRL